MEIYLGVASFVFFLKASKKEFSLMGADSSLIVLWLPTNDPPILPFSISAEYRKSKNCGFIATTEENLMGAFSIEDYNYILQNCKKEYCKREDIDNRTPPVSHCPVRLDPDTRGKIPVKIGRKIFNCRLDPI